MVTIHNLDVHLDVQGEGDEAVFVRLFQKYMRRWCEQENRQKQQAKRAAADRSLGDRQSDGDE